MATIALHDVQQRNEGLQQQMHAEQVRARVRVLGVRVRACSSSCTPRRP